MHKEIQHRRTRKPSNLYQRQGIWWIRYSVGGKKMRRSLGTEKLKEAKRMRNILLAKRSAAAKLGIETPIPQKPLTFGMVLDRWLESRRADSTLRKSSFDVSAKIAKVWLRPYFGSMIMSDITVGIIEAFLTYLRTTRSKTTNRPLREGYVREIFAKLHAMYRQAIRRSWYTGPNPLDQLERKPRRGSPRDTVLTVEEANRLLGHLSGSLYYKVAICLATGLRWGELHGLAWQDIDLDSKPPTLTVRRSYRGKPKNKASEATIPISGDAENLFRRWLIVQNQSSPFVFASRQGKLLKSDKGHGIKAAAKRARISKNIHPHVFRHTFGTWLFESTGDPKLVQRLMRHASFMTSMQYVHDRRSLSDAVNRLPKLSGKS